MVLGLITSQPAILLFILGGKLDESYVKASSCVDRGSVTLELCITVTASGLGVGA